MQTTKILFSAEQYQLGSPPRLIVKTTKMSVWSIKVAPGERLVCEHNESIFYARTLDAGDITIRDNAGNSANIKVMAETNLEFNLPAGFGDVVDIENSGETSLKFISVEHQSLNH